MENLKIKLFTALLYFIISTEILAGAWVQEKSSYENISTYEKYHSHKFWDLDKNLTESSSYTEHTLKNYFEYGASEKVTVALEFQVAKIVANETLGSKTGLREQKLLSRFMLKEFEGKVLSTEVEVIYPGSAKRFSDPAKTYDFDIAGKVLYGQSDIIKICRTKWFIDISLGYRKYFSSTPNQKLLDIRLGGKTNDARWEFFILESNEYNSKRYLANIQPSILYWHTQLIGFEIGTKQDFLGKDIGKGSTIFVSLWFKGKL